MYYICRKNFFFELREFRHIRSFIPKYDAILNLQIPLYIVIALYMVFQKYSLHRLQKYKTLLLVRFVTRTARSSHNTPILKSLHWLPVKYRINFKLCCITYRTLINRINPHSVRSFSFNSLM